MRYLPIFTIDSTVERRPEKAVRRFFNRVGDVYNNPHGVEIAGLLYDAVYVAAGWPGIRTQENIVVEIGVEARNYTEFIKLFGIVKRTRAVIDTITAARLMALYLKGKAEVFCCLSESGTCSLSFKKVNNRLRATDEYDIVHDVYERLNTAEEFIGYTQKYCLLRD